MEMPSVIIPITEIPVKYKNIQLYMKREDLVHPDISGNKYWKLFYNINHYWEQKPKNPLLTTFGGAFSNHIAATAALAKDLGIPSIGIIRGEELSNKWQDNPTLQLAHEKGMKFRFVSREAYRDKLKLSEDLQIEFPDALIIPEGGTNSLAVKGIQHMLSEETKKFDYLCTAVGTGGTISGLSLFAEEYQRILGFKVVNDPKLEIAIKGLTDKNNVILFDAHDGKYGKINEELVEFINQFYTQYQILLDPIYTGKMMKSIFELIENNYFPDNAKILAFHTGGLQGIKGANAYLEKQNRPTIECTL